MKIGENAKRSLGERRRAYKGRERDWPGGILPEPERRSGHGKGLSDGRRPKRGADREPGSRRKNERKKAPCLHTVQEDME